VFIQPQINNSDSTSNVSGFKDPDIQIRNATNNNTNVESKPNSNTSEVQISVNDSISTTKTLENLFTVPYRCTLNTDSLKIEMRKVVLEIDTIPKGLSLIAPQNAVDSTTGIPFSYSKSIFTNHLLKPLNDKALVRVEGQNNWIFFTFLLSLFLIAILRVFYQKKFTLFINAFVSKRFSNQIIREENALTQSTSVILSVVFFLSISLFFYLVSEHFQQSVMGLIGFQKFSVIFIMCISFYLIKLFVNKFWGYIFKVYKEIDEYIINQFLVLQILGILLTICCILIAYNFSFDQLYAIYFGFGIMILGFIVRMIKSIGIANMNTYSPIYIFLYLCTLEILPLIIIVKLIIR
jgi:hypothetical protein